MATKRRSTNYYKFEKFVPFSKKNVIFARAEAYVFSFILILLVFLDKDVSSISTILLPLSWGGYKLIQSLYIKSAEREHLEEIRCGRLRESLEASDIEDKISELESEDITAVLDEE